MKIRRAGNLQLQSLASHPDVRATVDAIMGDLELLRTAATILREYTGRNPEGLQDALDAELLAHAAWDDTVSPSVTQLIAALSGLYANARSDDDANQKRGKVLECLVYSVIAKYYDHEICSMNCLVDARANAYKRVTFKEVDVCAWSNSAMSGEAYECKTKPHWLTKDDCDNLLAIYHECLPYAVGLRVGMVSFDNSEYVLQQIRWLAQKSTNPVDYSYLVPFGYNNLLSLNDELPDPQEV